MRIEAMTHRGEGAVPGATSPDTDALDAPADELLL
jgi:hypothetical protein